MGVAAEDVELIVALARGDRDALGHLYDRHAPAMLALGLKLLREAWDEYDITMHLAAFYKRVSKVIYVLQLVLG